MEITVEEEIPILREERPSPNSIETHNVTKLTCSETSKKLSIISLIVALFIGSMLIVKYGFVAQLATFLNYVKEMGWWGNFTVCLCFVMISFPLILGAYIPLTLGSGAIYGVLMVSSFFGDANFE